MQTVINAYYAAVPLPQPFQHWENWSTEIIPATHCQNYQHNMNPYLHGETCTSPAAGLPTTSDDAMDEMDGRKLPACGILIHSHDNSSSPNCDSQSLDAIKPCAEYSWHD